MTVLKGQRIQFKAEYDSQCFYLTMGGVETMIVPNSHGFVIRPKGGERQELKKAEEVVRVLKSAGL